MPDPAWGSGEVDPGEGWRGGGRGEMGPTPCWSDDAPGSGMALCFWLLHYCRAILVLSMMRSFFADGFSRVQSLTRASDSCF